MPYWDNDPTEDLFMEVTKRGNVGDDILAPQATKGTSAAVRLAQIVKEGDLVIHYDSGKRAIVRVSRVVGDPEHTHFEWTSSNAGEKAGRNEGIRVRLGSHVPVTPPVTLDEIRREQTSIFAIRQDLADKTGKGQPLYFPWIDYSGRLRTALPYLAKFPRAALDLFPRLREAVDGLA